ncbi:MAG: cell division protein FtsZ, partial [Rhodobacterales bacterium]
KMVDTLIIIPNQNLFRLANEKTTFTEAFSMADDVLYQGVKGVTDLMVRPGLINLDFADVRAVMDEMGKAMMGTGEASGEDRAIQAAEKAIANPLLDEISLRGAKGVLINITGGHDLTLFELDEAANRIREEVDADANIIVGSTMDSEMEGMMRVSVVATGIDAVEVNTEIPRPRRGMAQPLTQTVSAEDRAPEEHRPAAAAMAPAPAPAPVRAAAPAPAQTHQPAAAQQRPAQQRAPEPTFFEDLEEQQPAAAPQRNRYNDQHTQHDDALPPPAYQPRVAQFQPVHDEFEDDAHNYVAPRAPAPGTPSPEAMARLQQAVSKAAPQAAQHRQIPQQAPEPEQRPRFGINSLINRMTGQAAEGQERAAPQPQRQQPPVRGQAPQQGYAQQARSNPSEAPDPDQERIEIPAFLRRQAN